MRYQINNGTIRFIKFVTKKFINSLIFPFLIESLKIIFLEIKYETITPNEKENVFVKKVFMIMKLIKNVNPVVIFVNHVRINMTNV